MEKITISKKEYHELKEAYIKLKRLEEIDFDLVKQFKDSLEAVKEGRIRRVA